MATKGSLENESQYLIWEFVEKINRLRIGKCQ